VRASIEQRKAVKWEDIARRKWPNAVWVEGDGSFALLAHCRDLTITLWETRDKAKEAMQMIDRLACGGNCWRDHEIVDLRRLTPVRSNTRTAKRPRRYPSRRRSVVNEGSR
jgi:hypothetical protein